MGLRTEKNNSILVESATSDSLAKIVAAFKSNASLSKHYTIETSKKKKPTIIMQNVEQHDNRSKTEFTAAIIAANPTIKAIKNEDIEILFERKARSHRGHFRDIAVRVSPEVCQF